MSGEESSSDLALPVVFMEPAEADIERAYQWMLTFGFDVAERWLDGLQQVIEREAGLQAALPIRRPISPDSPPGRPLLTLLYRTAGRGSSTWHILFEIAAADNDGEASLRVVRIRHARSR